MTVTIVQTAKIQVMRFAMELLELLSKLVDVDAACGTAVGSAISLPVQFQCVVQGEVILNDCESVINRIVINERKTVRWMRSRVVMESASEMTGEGGEIVAAASGQAISCSCYETRCDVLELLAVKLSVYTPVPDDARTKDRDDHARQQALQQYLKLFLYNSRIPQLVLVLWLLMCYEILPCRETKVLLNVTTLPLGC